MTLPELREALLKLTDAQLAELAGKLGLSWDALDGLGRFGHTRALLERARDRRKLGLVEAFVNQHAALVPAESVDATEIQKETASVTSAMAAPQSVPVAPAPPSPLPSATSLDVPGAKSQASINSEAQPNVPEPATIAAGQSSSVTNSAPRAASHLPVTPSRKSIPLWLVGLIGLLLAGIIGLLILRRINDASVVVPTSTTVPTAIPTLARLPAGAIVPATPTIASPVSPTPGASIVVLTTPTVQATTAPAASPPAAPTVQSSGTTTQSEGVTVLPSATPRATETPAPTATPVAAALPRLQGEPDSPAAFVNVINQQVMDYLQGKVTPQDLAVNWQGTAYTGVQEFLDRRVTASLALAPRDGKSITSTMRYLNAPEIQLDAQGNATVRVREGWKYGSRITGKIACETRDYLYRFVKVEGRYKVDEFSGNFVDARCFE